MLIPESVRFIAALDYFLPEVLERQDSITEK
jgi:hypothetical protein